MCICVVREEGKKDDYKPWLYFMTFLGILVVPGLTAFAIFSIHQNSDDIPGLDEKALANNFLIKSVSIHYEFAVGEEFLKGHDDMADLLKHYRRRVNYLVAIGLIHNVTTLEEDVTNWGECNLVCKRFDDLFKTVVGHLVEEHFDNFPEALKKLENKVKQIVGHVVRSIFQRNASKVLSAAKDLANNSMAIQPAVDYFISE
ncbi:unnamed protein product [Bursaphelenchus xylophilus]|uniref:(pine wood nematode) hypothetical protein n=1 Tax=Bursaphelenchus xylophilus TaxID=6326 RepID=A0A1I7S9D3_BURXY|nr:unnamed protein product [Bursaphelenchus xylophilus]CAG9100537.1 unnamed protein product [Bursaphelenchus xylophilus]